MSKSFNDLLSTVTSCSLKKLAVSVAQDDAVLEAVRAAKDRHIADSILVGDEAKIRAIAKEINTNIDDFTDAFYIFNSRIVVTLQSRS